MVVYPSIQDQLYSLREETMEANQVRDLKWGLWAIAVSIIILSITVGGTALGKKQRYLPMTESRVVDSYTGQAYIFRPSRSKVEEPRLRFDPLTMKIEE